MYSLPDYGRMLGEPTRFGAYRRALERAVSPGGVVIDLGAGPGVFALLAARAGARRVYAVEPDPVLTLAPELASANGVRGLVTFHGLSTSFEPEERADVLISDLRGVLPTFTDHLPSVIDARRRLLAEGGRLLPQKDVFWVAPVCAPAARKRHLGGFEVAGLDLGPAIDRASHLWTRVELEAEAVVAEPGRVAVLDYRTIESTDVAAELEFELDRAATLDGLAAWFDAEIDEHEHLSNAPSSTSIYGQAFFPFRRPLEARAGDRLVVRFKAHHVPGEDYLYRWSGRLERRERAVERFEHSTFHGTSVSASALMARSPHHRPALPPEARIDAAILELLDGRRTLGEAAAELRRRLPESFAKEHDALRRVSAVADRYGST